MFFHRIQSFTWLILSTCLAASTSWAHTSSTQTKNVFGQHLQRYHYILAPVGGYVWLNPTDEDQHFTGTDQDQFIYNSHATTQHAGLGGLFAGIEWQIPNTSLINRFGLEYDYVGSIKVKGTSKIGVEPATATPYTYQYNEQNQQILAVAKILMMADQYYHPYAMLGLGAAFNRLSNFTTSTSQQGSINIAPIFNSNTEAAFTYSLGLGIELDVSRILSIGIGYRFSDFGHSTFDDGQVSFNNYHAEFPFSLKNDHAYANQIIMDFNFFI